MRSLVVLAVLLGVEGGAQADPPAGELRAGAEQPLHGQNDHDDDDTFLHLDESFRLSVDALALKTEHFERRFPLGKRGRVTLKSDWRQTDRSVPVRGWRAAIDGSYDLGFVRVVTNAGIEHVDTDLGRGSVMTGSIGLRKTFRISPSVQGWVGLTLGYRRWTRPPPDGESNGTQFLLSTGLTY